MSILATLASKEVLPSVVGAGASLINGLFGWQSTKDTNKEQERLMKLQNQFQLDAMRENNEFNRKQAFDMFDYEANYNSPLAQMERLREAGLNPSVAYAGNLGSSGNVSAAAPSASSAGVSPVMPNLSVPGSPFQGGFDSLESISRIFANVSAAKKQGAETSQIETLLDANLRKLESEINVNEVKAAYDDIQRRISEAQLPYASRQAAANLKKTLAEYALAISQKDLNKANKLLTNIQRQYNSKQLEILKKQEPFLVQEIEERVKLVQEQQKTEQTQQGANRASAKASEASARASDSVAAKNYAEVQTINAIRPAVKDQAIALANQTAALASKTGAEATLAWKTIGDNVDKLLSEINLTDTQEKYYRSQFELAIKQKNWYDLNQVLGSLAPLTGVITTIAHMTGGMPAQKK